MTSYNRDSTVLEHLINIIYVPCSHRDYDVEFGVVLFYVVGGFFQVVAVRGASVVFVDFGDEVVGGDFCNVFL